MSGNKNMILGLRTTIYMVNNLKEAIEWYSKAFNTEPYFNEPFYVGFNIKGYELGLQPSETNSNSNSENVLSYWGVENIDEAYAHFLKNGAKIHEAPTNVGGELMVATVKDPWNNIIGLIYNPYFKL